MSVSVCWLSVSSQGAADGQGRTQRTGEVEKRQRVMDGERERERVCRFVYYLVTRGGTGARRGCTRMD